MIYRLVNLIGNMAWRRVALLGATLFVFGALAGVNVGVAQAAAPTCGGSATADGWNHTGPPSRWEYLVSANCGVGKTFRVNLQQSTNGSSGWSNVTEIMVSTCEGCANHWTSYDMFDSSGPTCSNNLYYRVKVTWADGSDTTGGRKDGC